MVGVRILPSDRGIPGTKELKPLDLDVSRYLLQSCVCVFVGAISETMLPCGLETSGQRAYRLYWNMLVARDT